MNKAIKSKKISINTQLEEGVTLGDMIEIKVQEALIDAGLAKPTSFDEAFRHLK